MHLRIDFFFLSTTSATTLISLKRFDQCSLRIEIHPFFIYIPKYYINICKITYHGLLYIDATSSRKGRIFCNFRKTSNLSNLERLLTM